MYDVFDKEKMNIENIIYEIRGKQIMFDSDLAKLYNVETKRINEAVKNNLEKFPERFSWILTDEEYYNLRSQIATSRFTKILTMEEDIILEFLQNKVSLCLLQF